MKTKVMTPKEFILEVDDKIEEAVSYGYPIHIDTEEALFWWMEQYADYKVDLARNKHGNFTNGTFTLSWKDAVIPEPPETVSYENCINFMEFYASQTDDLTNIQIKYLDEFNAYLIKVANAKVGFRFKVKELKRVINTIINQAEVPEEPIQLDPSYVKSYGNGYR